MTKAERIAERIRRDLAPETLEILDESDRHRGHAGYLEGGESHYRLRIRATSLDALSRIERHRAIHRAIGADLMGEIHALAIEFA